MTTPTIAAEPARFQNAAVAPLSLVLAITAMTSVGTAIGWSGIFYITEARFGFTGRDNLLLGAVQGALYAAAAIGAGRVMRLAQRFRTKRGAASLRLLLATLLVASAALCVLPWAAGTRWSVWLFALGYIVCAGLTWPVVEAFLSGGRRGSAMRRATGRFNITWGIAVILAMWGMAPFLANAALEVLAGLCILHLLTLPLVAMLPPAPGPAAHGDISEHDIPPERARTLLHAFRICLLTSYSLHAALSPVLPQIMTRLDVDTSSKTLLASVWMTTRLGMFLLLERWNGWHGRWRTVWWSSSLMVVGTSVCFAAPTLPVLIVGLAILGAGVGAVYAAAIYYAMEAGASEVDAGGAHEGMIGLGYTAGPLIALLIGSIFGLF